MLHVATLSVVVQVDPFGDNGVRIRQAVTGTSIVDPPFQALVSPPPPSSGPVEVGRQSLVNGNIRVDVASDTGYVTVSSISPPALLLTQTSLFFGPPAPASRPNMFRVGVSFDSVAGERIYGLGEHKGGRLNMMPWAHNIQDSQYYPDSFGGDIFIPFYASSRGYSFVWNCPSYGTFSASPPNASSPGGVSWLSNATANADFWIGTAPTGADPAASPFAPLLAAYAAAVGSAPSLVPDWALRFIQSKNRYRRADDVVRVARGHAARGIPLGVVVVDYMHWANWGDFSFDPRCFPDPAAMVASLREVGAEVMVSVWPVVTPQGAWYPAFATAAPPMLLTNLSGVPTPLESWAGEMYFTDPLNPAAAKMYFDAFMQGYGRFGIRAAWLDASEPERAAADNFGQFRMAGAAHTDTEVGEAWVRAHTAAIADGMRRAGHAADDYFILTRSAWAGSWRSGAAVWSGDTRPTWKDLRDAVGSAQQMALSGQVLWTSDMCGYLGGGPADAPFRELCLRWIQFGAFCPLMRLHGCRDGGPPADVCGPTNGDNELWTLFAADPAAYATAVRMVLLRDSLVAYVRDAHAAATSAAATPMVRPMFFAFPGDAAAAAAEAEDQFMLGPDWLVAPVLAAGATSRSVYLPKLPQGAQWVYWWNGTAVGGGGARVEWPLAAGGADFPLFYRDPAVAMPAPPPPPRSVEEILRLAAAADAAERAERR